uniref:Bm12215 n=1 Tax=Brugia malayi TaxID=6279 RepID=A0A1I9GBC3_BRUMA|nr:Bm12215 [Brugia malayi]
MGDIEIDVEKTSRTPVKRRMKKSCDCTPKKRSKERRKQSLTIEHPEEQTDDTDEEEIVITRTYNDKLANDFDQMNLYPEGKQTLQPGTNSISRSMSDDTNIISLSDDG